MLLEDLVFTIMDIREFVGCPKEVTRGGVGVCSAVCKIVIAATVALEPHMKVLKVVYVILTPNVLHTAHKNIMEKLNDI